MKAKVVRLVAALALVFSIAAAVLPAIPAAAQEAPTLTATFVGTGSSGSSRWISLQSGDEVVQFTRSNVILPSSVNAGFATVSSMSGTVSGDLNGSFSAGGNGLSFLVGVRPGYNGFGFSIGKATFTCTSPSGSFDVISVSNHDFTWPAPAPIPQQGYWISTNESGCFAGEKLIGTASSIMSDSGGVQAMSGVVTFRRYSASEITQLTPDTTFSGTYAPGNMRNIPTLMGDEIIKIMGTPNYFTPANDNTWFEDASSQVAGSITSGPFPPGATTSMSHNSVTYSYLSTVMGWAVGKWSISTGTGAINGILVNDTSSLTTQTGYMFSRYQNNTGDYANQEYFGICSFTSTPPNQVSGTATVYELSPPVPASKTETTQPGTYIVDAKSEADTEVTKEGSGTPTITIAQYSSNPGGTFQGDIGKYVDVYVPDTTDVDQIEIKLYYTDADIVGIDEPTLKMYWLNGAAWEPCSDTGVNTANLGPYSGYIWAHITLGSIPNLSYLSGQQFGGGGQGAGGTGGGGEDGGGGAAGVPVFPSIYIGIGAALGAGVVAYGLRRRLFHRE